MMNRVFAVLTLLLLGGSAYAVPPEPGPVDVLVTNDDTMPVPVEVKSAPLVACFWHAGSGSSSTPFSGAGGAGAPLSNVVCPTGVDKIKVKRIASTNVLRSFSTVVKFQAVVGYAASESQDLTDPAGILAVMTNGAPIADVLQSFVLDRNDTTRSLYFRWAGSTGLADLGASNSDTVIFSGTQVQ